MTKQYQITDTEYEMLANLMHVAFHANRADSDWPEDAEHYHPNNPYSYTVHNSARDGMMVILKTCLPDTVADHLMQIVWDRMDECQTIDGWKDAVTYCLAEYVEQSTYDTTNAFHRVAYDFADKPRASIAKHVLPALIGHNKACRIAGDDAAKYVTIYNANDCIDEYPLSGYSEELACYLVNLQIATMRHDNETGDVSIRVNPHNAELFLSQG